MSEDEIEAASFSDSRLAGLTRALEHYGSRERKCDEAAEYAKERLIEVAERGWTVAELKAFLDQRGIPYRSRDRKGVLMQKALDNYQTFLSERMSRNERYREQKEAILAAFELRAVDKFSELRETLVGSERGEELIPVPPDLQGMERTVLTNFKRPGDAEAVYEAVRERLGEGCLLYGGSMLPHISAQTTPVLIRGVSLRKGAEEGSGGARHSWNRVSVDLLGMKAGLVHGVDYCDIEDDSPASHAPGEGDGPFFDIEPMRRALGSWKIACPSR
jgi:hypothetical protein